MLPLAVDEILVSAVSVAALVATLWFALRLPWENVDRPGGGRRHVSWSAVALAAAAALWLEPITTTLGHGQINLVIALLIVSDLSRRDTDRTKGALIGLAGGLKLTPLIFVPYLLLTRRPRAAAVALGTFAATIALAFALAPVAAQRYWGGLFLDSTRTGGCCTPSNQSLRGAILGLDPSFGGARVVILAAIAAIAGIAVAARAGGRGDEAMGFSICALTGLLVSPVSWSHHWTLIVPVLLVLGVRAYRRRSSVGLIAIAGVLALGYSYLPELVTNAYPGGAGLPFGWTLASTSYVLTGVVALAVACAHECRLARARR